MNVYIVTEGKADCKVYKHWIPLVNPNISYVEKIEEVDSDKFFLISGNGYPSYFEVIDSAIQDVNTYTSFDRLVIVVDSEDMTKAEKYSEITGFISGKACHVDIKIVVQHFCIETWGLGNRRLIGNNIRLKRLQNYLRLFNVRNNDPELLPRNDEEGLNRSQFAYKYLRVICNNKYKRLSYSKKNPKIMMNKSFFGQIQNRHMSTDHIASFEDFLVAFANN